MPQLLVRFRFVRIFAAAAALLAGACAQSAFAGSVCYVSQAAAGANTGADWADAYTDLQSAVRNAACTQIWAAKGVYKPGTATTDSFSPRAGVAMYGGFAGTETALAQRTPDTIAANPTVLSGDIDGNDPVDAYGVLANGANIVGSNSIYVVLMNNAAGSGYGADTVIDGFTITAGDASQSADSGIGGGLRCDASYSQLACNFTLNDMVFSGNRAGAGGALSLSSSYGTANATLSKIVFSGNAAVGPGASGGAVSLSANPAAGTVSPTFSNVVFSGNSSQNWGGAIDINVNNGTVTPTFDNAVFIGNVGIAGRAGAISAAAYGGSGVATPTLRNSILWGDDANNAGEIFIQYGARANFDHSIVQNGCPSGNYVCTNMIAGDPQLGALGNYGGAVPSILPGLNGSAVGTGTCLLVDDIRGTTRPQGLNTACDIGAVELREPLLTVSIAGDGSVSASATPVPMSGGIGNCTSDCAAQYYAEPPPVVTLTATPNSQSSFAGWSGDCSGSSPVVSITVAAAMNCTATFMQIATPTIALSSACGTTFVAGQPFTLNATVQGVNLTGSVTFNDGNGNIVCNEVAQNAGAASCTYTLNAPGAYALGASYGGDANHAPASATPFDVIVLDPADVIFRNGFEPESAMCPIE